VTVSIDVPQPRADVYAYLDVMANHEQFTDHILTNWQVSGPATGIGAKAVVTAKAGGRSERVEFEVIEAEPDVMIKERNKARGGKRVGTGTYVLSDTPGGGTHVEVTYEFEQVPAMERPLLPLMRSILRKGNERAMTRLAERLAALPAAV
jgi:hypothetical protein